MKRPTWLILACVLILGGLIATWLRPKPLVMVSLGNFTAAGVQVDLSLEQNNTSTCVLAARYTPLDGHYHVYSKDLPPDGIDGLGRPTRLDIVHGLIAAGQLTADATTSDFKTEGLPEVLPVYPNGPLTLRLPVSVVGDGSAQVKMSYMACSAATCLPPTTKTLAINLSQCKA